MTDLETVLRIMPRSEPHVAPLRPRGREYLWIALAVSLALVAFL